MLMNEKLQYDGPVVLAILDGVGLAPDSPGNAVSKARTPFLGNATRDCLHIALEASGEAVGLLPGVMGNSEVGHNTMGAGRAIKQGIARIDEALRTGEIFESKAWHDIINRLTSTSVGVDNSTDIWYNKDISPRTLHFAGIFSDGGVHSHLDHLKRLIERAYSEGVRKIRVHAVFDGRDVPPQSEPKYIKEFEIFAKDFPGADIKIASGGGRMVTVADRYESNWEIVARGWDMMVNGKADYYFKTPEEAIQILRRINPEVQDQYLPAFVVVDDKDTPVGKVEKGDALIYFDFRADRAIEIAQAFTYYDFPYFNRGNYSPNDVYFAGMTEYNSDTHVPEHRLVEPINIEKPLNKVLGENGVAQLAISETVKFGHITYYFNGNSYEKADKEDFIEIPSDTVPLDTRPWMKTAEITDKVIENLDNYQFIRLNFPGGDMVGHTANMEATIIAMETIDLELARLATEVRKRKGILIVVADHGNAEELLDENGAKKTSHTLNKVPLIIYDKTSNRAKYTLNNVENPGLKNLASTILFLLGLDAPEPYSPSLLK